MDVTVPDTTRSIMGKMSRRTPILSAMGLAGYWTGVVVIGAGVIYLVRKFDEHFKHQSEAIRKFQDEVKELKEELAALKEPGIISSVVRAKDSRPLDTKSSTDDDEYLTPDEEDEDFEAQIEPTQEKGDEQSEFFTRIDMLLEGTTAEQHQAYNILCANMSKFETSCDFWWRLAKAAHFEGTIAGNRKDEALVKELFEKGFTYAQKAVDLNGESANAHKWLAILCGARSEYLGINEKIQGGYKFKEHVDRAISLDPTDSTCYYLLGRFCLEISMLSWIERQVATRLFSAPPTSTPHEAMEYFQKCETLRAFMDNRFYMAKCYYAQNNIPEAKKWLDLAASMPATTATDKACLENVNQLRKQLG